MENASKALIIAGAILLSILIISLGIMIFGQASEVVDQNAMSDLEITQFNTKFTQYAGTKVRGAQVNSLLDTVIQNNVTQTDPSRLVSIQGTKTSESKLPGTALSVKATTGADANWSKQVPSGQPKNQTSTGRALTGKTYYVECETDSSSGLVTNIIILAN